MLIRYEANLDGTVEIGDPFTEFDEFKELLIIFKTLGWEFKKLKEGRGGYFLFDIKFKENFTSKVHIYLKRLTFGGRESRPYEKRLQFSAALDRTGFIDNNDANQDEFCLIIGIYKRKEFEETIICTWDINDWGHNIGRAFNCFIDVRAIATSLKFGFAQHKSSIGQIACCFKPENFLAYIEYRKLLHSDLLENLEENIKDLIEKHLLAFFEDIITPAFDNSELENFTEKIPNYSHLFQLTIDILKKHNGIANTDTIEFEAGNILKLTEAAKLAIHNENEGYRTELGYQLAWARFYLKKAGLIECPKRTIWQLTELGINTNFIDRDSVIKIATQKEIKKEVDDNVLYYVDDEEGIEKENELYLENLPIENPFDPNQVDIRTRTMSLDLLIKRLRNNAIDMNTSFQRKANLWDITKQSRLIESILVRFPLPAFYFDGSNDDNWLVVDGLQRLSSLDNFVNKEAFQLQNLEFLNQFNGMKFSELPSYLQRRIEEFEITAYIIAAGTPKVLKFNVFKRINTGGLTLTPQEIRNALNQDTAIYIKKMADLKSFKIATQFSISEERMLDQEFVTRFLAFYLFDLDKYNGDLDRFLNEAMEELNYVQNIEEIINNFDKAMNAAIQIFNGDAFRKRFSRNDSRKPINKTLFEVWSVLLSKLSIIEINKLIENKNLITDKFIDLLNTDEAFNKAITSATGDKTRTKKRFTAINKIIESILLN